MVIAIIYQNGIFVLQIVLVFNAKQMLIVMLVLRPLYVLKEYATLVILMLTVNQIPMEISVKLIVLV